MYKSPKEWALAATGQMTFSLQYFTNLTAARNNDEKKA